jgi:hypothetical protein
MFGVVRCVSEYAYVYVCKLPRSNFDLGTVDLRSRLSFPIWVRLEHGRPFLTFTFDTFTFNLHAPPTSEGRANGTRLTGV